MTNQQDQNWEGVIFLGKEGYELTSTPKKGTN